MIEEDYNPGRAIGPRWERRHGTREQPKHPHPIIMSAYMDNPAFGALLDALLSSEPQSVNWWIAQDQVRAALDQWDRQWRRNGH